jgi:hypothetical protein
VNEVRDVLVIDDEAERLETLATSLRVVLGDGIGVRTWLPEVGQEAPLERFDREVRAGLALIVTDDDLTKSRLGILGSSVTTWAQDKFIPVCNFSRKPERRLPRERNFFELRVPPQRDDENVRAEYIERIYRGFEHIRQYIGEADHGRPIAELLAGAMGLPQLSDDVAPFLMSIASANSSLMQAVLVEQGRPSDNERVDLLTFIFGHVLVNAVLEFPGPILSRRTLTAYCGVSEQMDDQMAHLFAEASYDGPFSMPSMYFQRRLVDRRIDELAKELTDAPDEPDEYARAAVEQAIGSLLPHGCHRCGGTRGGYWCPFTQRAVCTRIDCSVVSNTWIPRGATLCRVEHDYFEELAPLLGD